MRHFLDNDIRGVETMSHGVELKVQTMSLKAGWVISETPIPRATDDTCMGTPISWIRRCRTVGA
jgi:hypothetical protein